MNRYARDKRESQPKPVERIELNEDKLPQRLILVAVLLVIGIAALAYGLSRATSSDVGWTEIPAATGETNVAAEFILHYNLGQADLGPTAERKAVSVVYSDAVATAWSVFASPDASEEAGNLAFLCVHPNQTVVIREALYTALQTLEDAGSRLIYLAPVYEMYDSLFACAGDNEAVNFDPARNADLAAFCAEAAAYAADSESVNIELLGDCRAQLTLSAEYMDFLRENGVVSILGFGWARNAFIADYIAAELIARGYGNGWIESEDGFARYLSGAGAQSVAVLQNGAAAAYVSGSGWTSAVSLCSYPLRGASVSRHYVYADGTPVAGYVDPADGVAKAALPELLAVSKTDGCAVLALKTAAAFAVDTFREETLDGVSAVWSEGGEIQTNDEALVIQ